MFSPPKLAIAICVTVACLLGTANVTAQNQNTAEYNRRMAAMQNARQRASQVLPQEAVVQTAAAPQQMEPKQTVRTVAAVQEQAVAPVRRSARIARATGVASRVGRYAPKHTRTAQLMDGTIIDGGSPIVGGSGFVGDSTFVDGGVVGSSIGVPMESEMMVGCADGNCGGGCGSCGDLGGFFENDCCGRGGCPDGPCWLDGLGKIFRNADFFGGVTSFRSGLYSLPGTANNTNLIDDCSHGLYGGFNLGIPLCRLTCGVFSGQFGVRTVNTNFNGNAFTDDDRNQLFMTAGFYRRVDYGIQVGVVADFLREEWYSNSDTVQLRGDIGYVWANGTTFGFRLTDNVQDDVVSGTFNNVPFNDMIVSTNDNYRFYLRHEAASGGYGEVFGGWSEAEQGIVGLNFDFPITDRLAMESGFTYFLSDDGVPANSGFIGGNQSEAYNMYVGFSIRPSGRSWYRNYDRPLFDVADNGTMLMTRN